MTKKQQAQRQKAIQKEFAVFISSIETKHNVQIISQISMDRKTVAVLAAQAIVESVNPIFVVSSPILSLFIKEKGE